MEEVDFSHFVSCFLHSDDDPSFSCLGETSSEFREQTLCDETYPFGGGTFSSPDTSFSEGLMPHVEFREPSLSQENNVSSMEGVFTGKNPTFTCLPPSVSTSHSPIFSVMVPEDDSYVSTTKDVPSIGESFRRQKKEEELKMNLVYRCLELSNQETYLQERNERDSLMQSPRPENSDVKLIYFDRVQRKRVIALLHKRGRLVSVLRGIFPSQRKFPPHFTTPNGFNNYLMAENLVGHGDILMCCIITAQGMQRI